MIHPIENLVEVFFLESVCPFFSFLLLEFQTEAPMIHILYSKIKLMNRFIKPEVIKGKSGTDDELVLGDKIRKNIKTDLRKKGLLREIFLCKISRVYAEKLPLFNSLSKKGTSCEIIHSSSLISKLGTFHDPRGY